MLIASLDHDLTSQGVLRSHTKTLCFAAEAELPPLPLFSTPNSWTLLLLSWLEAPLGRWLCEEVVKRRTFLGETQQMEVAAVAEDGGRPLRPSLAMAALRRRRRFVAEVWQV